MFFLSYSLLYFYFLLLHSDETKLPKVWAKQHFMAEHLWKCPTVRCVYFEFPWDTAKLLFKSQQETGVLLEVCGASFHWETARCVWERGLNSPNSLWVIAVGFFTVGKSNQLSLSDTGFPSFCLTLGFTDLFSLPSLLPHPWDLCRVNTEMLPWQEGSHSKSFPAPNPTVLETKGRVSEVCVLWLLDIGRDMLPCPCCQEAGN